MSMFNKTVDGQTMPNMTERLYGQQQAELTAGPDSQQTTPEAGKKVPKKTKRAAKKSRPAKRGV